MATTFRQDVVTGLYNVLDAYKTANYTAGIDGKPLIASVFKGRPSKYSELPLAFVFSRNERISHDAGTRTRIMSPSIALVDQISDNLETSARLDIVIDGLIDALTAEPHIVANTASSDWQVVNDELRIEGVIYRVEYITLRDLTIQEGRA